MGKTIHGQTGTIAWFRWQHMRRRCRDKSHPSYPYYGAKGITYCERWDEFKNFLEDMGEPPTDGHTLDRLDPNQNYSKGNCRWATTAQQNSEGKNNLFMVTYRGKTQCLRAWSKELGFNVHSMYTRIRRGWTIEKAFETPLVPKAQRDPLGRFQ